MPISRILLTFLLVSNALTNLPVRAGEPETAEDVIAFSSSKMAGYRNWSADYSQQMNLLGGQMTIEGRMIQQPPKKMRMLVDMPIMGVPGKMMVVMGEDGIMWQEMDVMGQKQVTKIDMAVVFSNTMAQAGIKTNPLDNIDPSKQWAATKEMFDFTVKGTEMLHDQPMYVLEGSWKASAPTNPKMAAMAAFLGKTRVFIGQIDGFTHKMEQFDKSKTNIVMSIEFTDLKFNEDVPDETFSYRPPPNIEVNDLTELAGTQARGMVAPSPAPLRDSAP